MTAQFVAPEGSDYHNSSTLPLEDEGEADALLLRLERGLVSADADEITHVLRALRQRQQTALVALGPRTHVSALDRAARLIVERASPDLRARVEAVESAAVRRALRARDLDILMDHATRGRALGASQEATWHAARLLFERGNWWEAASFAARVDDRPEAAELAAAARERLPPPRPPPAADGPWEVIFSFRYRLEPEELVGLPLVFDGRGGEVVVLDGWGLNGFDLLATQKRLLETRQGLAQTIEEFLWDAQVLGAERFNFLRPVARPAPRRFSVARSGDRIVLPFNVATEARRRSPWAERQARLLALDLEPGPEWAVTVAWQAQMPRRGSFSTAFGPPVIAGDRVFVQVFRPDIDAEVGLIAFDLYSGEQIFETPLVRGPFVSRFASRVARLDVDDLDKRGREGRLAVRDGIVYACTGFGAVAAVDGITGRILHTFRYDRLFSVDRMLYDPAYMFDTGGWDDEPVRLYGDRVVVAPSDSRFLYMLALEPGTEGHLILEDPIERFDRVDVADLLPDPTGGAAPAVLALRRRDGRSGVVLLSPDGHTLAASPPLPEGEAQRGRPTMLGRLLLVPTDAGVRIYDPERLADVEPLLLDNPPGLPAARAVHPVEGGLVVLCVSPDDTLYVVFWASQA